MPLGAELVDIPPGSMGMLGSPGAIGAGAIGAGRSGLKAGDAGGGFRYCVVGGATG
jgi:hypothetical protein